MSIFKKKMVEVIDHSESMKALEDAECLHEEVMAQRESVESVATAIEQRIRKNGFTEIFEELIGIR